MNIYRTEKYFKNKKRGQVMIFLVVLFMIISLIVILGLVNPTLRNIKVANNLFKSKQSLFLADSGVADAVYRIKNNLQISGEELMTLDGNIVTTSLVDTVEGKIVTSVSNYSDYLRNIQVKVDKGFGASFFYGVQTGQGGFEMVGSARVNGNIYSNGPIKGGNVTGSAVSATTTAVGIDGVNVGENGVGDAWANVVNNSNVAGALKCQTGTSNTGKNCDTSFGNPPEIPMPISAEQITGWKAEAEAGGIITGDFSTTSNPVRLGPVRITGDLDVKGEIIMTGTVWVEGVLSFQSSNSKIILATSTFGDKGGVIIVDKYTSFSGGSQIESTGSATSYVMLLVTSDCPASSFCGKKTAISISGGAGSVVLAAPYGTIDFGGNSDAKGVIANKVIMAGGTEIDYEYGLANLNFVSGPSGSYQVSGYKETE